MKTTSPCLTGQYGFLLRPCPICLALPHLPRSPRTQQRMEPRAPCRKETGTKHRAGLEGEASYPSQPPTETCHHFPSATKTGSVLTEAFQVGAARRNVAPQASMNVWLVKA